MPAVNHQIPVPVSPYSMVSTDARKNRLRIYKLSSKPIPVFKTGIFLKIIQKKGSI